MPHTLNCLSKVSQTDQYREGAVVPIVKTGTDLCPWANLLKHLSQAHLSLPTSANGGNGFLFGNIQTKSGRQFIRSASKLSYSRCREVLLKKLVDVGLDPKCYSWHSFRNGGASSVGWFHNFGFGPLIIINCMKKNYNRSKYKIRKPP